MKLLTFRNQLLTIALWALSACDSSSSENAYTPTFTDEINWVTDSNFYIADTQNNLIRAISRSNHIMSAFAGDGSSGFSASGTAYASAHIGTPVSILVNKTGVVVFSNVDAGCVQALSGGVVLEVAGTCGVLSTTAGNGALATDATFGNVAGLCMDSSENIYVVDISNRNIRKIDANTGLISAFAGSGMGTYNSADEGVPATTAAMTPGYCAFDENDNMYVSDSFNHQIRKITPAGIITTILGTGSSGSSGDNGQAVDALANSPAALSVCRKTNSVFFADRGNHKIRKINLETGIVSTYAGTGSSGLAVPGSQATSTPLMSPEGVAAHDGEVFITVGYTGDFRMLRIDESGFISRILGQAGVSGNSGNGGQSYDALTGYLFSLEYWKSLL